MNKTDKKKLRATTIAVAKLEEKKSNITLAF